MNIAIANTLSKIYIKMNPPKTSPTITIGNFQAYLKIQKSGMNMYTHAAQEATGLTPETYYHLQIHYTILLHNYNMLMDNVKK